MSPILDSIGSVKGYGWGALLSSIAFDSIATVTVGSGGAANVEFTSIPATYSHLQIRGIMRCTTAASGTSDLFLNMNSDTGSNYSYHLLQGDGSTTAAGGAATQTKIVMQNCITRANSTANVFGATVIDILDYANTNKYKTMRSINGSNQNDTSTDYRILFFSGLWQSTSAITSLKLAPQSDNFAQYSHFAVYGIKSA